MGYSPFKMAPKSPLMKKLVGNQNKLPQQLQNAIKAAPESPAKQTLKKSAKKAFESGKMDKYGKPTLKKTASEAFKSGKMDKYAKSPAKAMTGPGVQEEAGKTGTAGTNSARGKATATEAKPKWDKELNSLVAARKGLKKGTAEYNRVQNRINEKMGSGVRRRTEETTKLASKKPTTASTAAPKPAAKKPAAKKAPSQADKFENALAKESAKAPMGSETRSKAPAAKKPAAKKPAAKKPAAKKTVGQKVKGTVRNARIARLNRKANRQEARAEDKTARNNAKADRQKDRAENKTARNNAKAAKLQARADKLKGK